MTSVENQEFFYQLDIDGSRYLEVNVMSCTVRKRQRVVRRGTGWSNRPTRGNSLITELKNELSSLNSTLLCFPGATVLSLDDHHQRLSSRAVTQLTNLSQVNNLNKSLGPVNNALCSALNPVFIASHFSRPREQVLDVWQRLVQLVQGVPTIGSMSPMVDAVFAADRGYKSKETIKFVNERLSATGIGTHKRSLDYPFVFGDGPINKRQKGMKVSERGFRAVCSATQRPQSGKGRTVEAALYRESCSRRISAIYHNNMHLMAAHNFDLIPKSFYRNMFTRDKIEEVQVVYDSYLTQPCQRQNILQEGSSPAKLKVQMTLQSVRQITILQSEDPGWFLARAFMFTSKTSYGFLCVLAGNLEQNMLGPALLLRGKRVLSYTDPMPAVLEKALDRLRVRLSKVFTELQLRTTALPSAEEVLSSAESVMRATQNSLSTMRKDDILVVHLGATRVHPLNPRNKSRISRCTVKCQKLDYADPITVRTCSATKYATCTDSQTEAVEYFDVGIAPGGFGDN